MKFNKLAKELDLSVAELADQVRDILPNANGGTEVDEDQKAQIIALLQKLETPEGDLLLPSSSQDPILAVLSDLIEEEAIRETPEALVSEMIERYLANPTDLPDDPDYKEAIITYVSLVKKRQTRRQQQLSKLRSRLRRQDSAAAPVVLESFYSTERSSSENGTTLGSSKPSPQLNAAAT